MNDLDMVRALRADAPQSSADRLAAGRDLLRTAMVPARRPLPRPRRRNAHRNVSPVTSSAAWLPSRRVT